MIQMRFISFLAPLAIGQRAYVMARYAPICVLTFILNVFFSETTYPILIKFHRNVPAIVLLRIDWKNLIPSKTLVIMATLNLKIFKIFENLLVWNHKA